MFSYLRSILGNYTPLSGDGIASLNIEYIVGAIILIMVIWLTFKMILTFVTALFKLK